MILYHSGAQISTAQAPGTGAAKQEQDSLLLIRAPAASTFH